MDVMEGLKEIVKTEHIQQLWNNESFALIKGKLSNSFTRFLNGKIKFLSKYLGKQTSLLNLILLNLIPIAYIKGSYQAISVQDTINVCAQHFEFILPFTLVSLFLKRIWYYIGLGVKSALVVLGIILLYIVAKPVYVKIKSSYSSKTSKNNVPSRT